MAKKKGGKKKKGAKKKDEDWGLLKRDRFVLIEVRANPNPNPCLPGWNSPRYAAP